MIVHEHFQEVRDKHKPSEPLTALGDLKNLPVNATTSQELRGLFLRYNVTQILARLAMVHANSYALDTDDLQKERLSLPSIISSESEDAGPTEIDSVLTVFGITEVINGRRKFTPTALGAFRDSELITYGLTIPLNKRLAWARGEELKASFRQTDPITGITTAGTYVSSQPGGRNNVYRLPVFSGPPDRKGHTVRDAEGKRLVTPRHEVVNSPGIVPRIIGDVARIALVTATVDDLNENLAKLRMLNGGLEQIAS